jgi:hypothetical protein
MQSQRTRSTRWLTWSPDERFADLFVLKGRPSAAWMLVAVAMVQQKAGPALQRPAGIRLVRVPLSRRALPFDFSGASRTTVGRRDLRGFAATNWSSSPVRATLSDPPGAGPNITVLLIRGDEVIFLPMGPAAQTWSQTRHLNGRRAHNEALRIHIRDLLEAATPRLGQRRLNLPQNRGDMRYEE